MGVLFSSILLNNFKYENFIIPLSNPGSLNEVPDNEYVKNRIFTNINHRKRGLVIGINYVTNKEENDNLNGCTNDLKNIKSFLKEKCFFSRGQVTCLENEQATRKNIENELKKLISYSKNYPGSELWFSYSGHGTSKHSFFEKDNKSEVICPSDYQTKGLIDDMWLQKQFISCLHPKTKLFVLMDCCNSGSNMNLPYCIKNDNIEEKREYNYDLTNICSVVKLSGCRDDETSIDYFDYTDYEYQGALTNSFLNTDHYKSLSSNIVDFKKNMKEKGFTQSPVLSFSKEGGCDISLL
jgi:hypothetical protein